MSFLYTPIATPRILAILPKAAYIVINYRVLINVICCDYCIIVLGLAIDIGFADMVEIRNIFVRSNIWGGEVGGGAFDYAVAVSVKGGNVVGLKIYMCL